MIFANLLHFYQPPTQKKYWIDRITEESYRKLIKIFLANENIKFTLNVNGVLCELWEKYGHTDIIDGIRTLVERGQVELTGSAKYHPLLPKLPVSEIRRQVLLNELSLNKYFGVVGPLLSKERKIAPSPSASCNDGNVIPVPPCGIIPNSPPVILNSSPVILNSFQDLPEKVLNQAMPAGRQVQHDSSIEYKLQGFFPPEMAYSPELGKIISELGYKWVICEELSFKGDVSYNKIYKEKGTDLFVFFRNRGASFKLLSGQIATSEVFLKEFGGSDVSQVQNDPSLRAKRSNLGEDRHASSRLAMTNSGVSDEYLLTAMDGETFGHHKVGLENCLKEIYESSTVEGVKISDLLLRFNDVAEVETRASTWALMKTEIEKNIPFSRWDDAENEIHKAQWELTNLAIEAVNGAVILSASEGSSESVSLDPSASPQDDTKVVIQPPPVILNSFQDLPEKVLKQVQYDNIGVQDDNSKVRARELLDKALHSDQYWWASAKPWWSLEMIERGAKELMDVVLGAQSASESVKSRAKELYFFIITTGFEWQRSGKVDEIARKNDEEIVMAANEDLGKYTREEILKMIKIQEDQMKKLSESLEFERAIHPRDRIKELKSFLD